MFAGHDQDVSSTTTDAKPVRREVGPSWVVVTRLTSAVHVGFVIALVLVTTLHGFDVHEGVVADVALAVLILAASLLVAWPKGASRS
jgi:hypothetical protein